MSVSLPPGRAVIDLVGPRMTAGEGGRLADPQVGGVILFARNYESPAQLRELTAAIRAVRDPALLIAVDHEGGRVQRFRDGFTVLPPMRTLGALWDDDAQRALAAARACGRIIAHELRACGVDLSFTPVLDLDRGVSDVIGARAFHADPAAVAGLALALQAGLNDGGMAACGKHFPGHGHVAADSHVAIPVDPRGIDEIRSLDLVPFRRLVEGGLAAVMPAHVIYPRIDAVPAGFSRIWHAILREELGFSGIVFSDDLSMEGAKAGGGVAERARAALAAGCDMLLLCNDPAAAGELLEALRAEAAGPVPADRLARVTGLRAGISAADYAAARTLVGGLA